MEHPLQSLSEGKGKEARRKRGLNLPVQHVTEQVESDFRCSLSNERHRIKFVRWGVRYQRYIPKGKQQVSVFNTPYISLALDILDLVEL
jgi:hypothetical protein